MDRRFLAILGVIVVALIAIFAFSQNSNKGSSGSTSSTQPTNHVMGKGAKGVTLIEYGDYQCSACYAYYQPVKDAVNQLSNDIYFQFRNLPLSPNPHPNAFAGARAAEAAALQGKFWEMHDKLYENQDPNGQTGWVVATDPLNQYFATFAKQLGLDVNKFKQDYASAKVNNVINADLDAFAKTGRQKSTPTFFLDGKYIGNTEFNDAQAGPTKDKIVQVLNNEIAKKNKSSSQ